MDHLRFSILGKLLFLSITIKEIHGNSENIFSLVKQYSLVNHSSEQTTSSENLYNITEVEKNLDYIIKLQMILNAEKVVPYLREEIYNNHEKYGITTEDIVDLWKLREHDLQDLTKTLEIPDILLNLNSFRIVLGIANLTFSEFYEGMKKNLTNAQLKQTLTILNIDPANFASAIILDTSEDQTYDVLNEGVFTWNKFEEIKNETGHNLPDMAKNLILDQLITRTISSVASDMQKLPMMNKDMYKNVWNRANITTLDIYRVVNIRRIVDNIQKRATENQMFGLAIAEYEIIMHRQMLSTLDEVMDVITIYGESSSTHRIYDDLTLVEGPLRNTMTLRSDHSITDKIEIIDKKENVPSSNCTYIDNDLIERNITLINVTQFNATVAVDEDVSFNMGNPVICEGKLLGLATENIMEEKIFVVDTFFKKYETTNSSSSSMFPYSSLLIFFIIILECQI